MPGPNPGVPAVKPPFSPGASQPAPAAVKKSEIPNKDGPCNTVTDTEVDPRLEGILADPRNYYRHYPEDHLRHLARYVDQHEWLVPADHQNHPIAVCHVKVIRNRKMLKKRNQGKTMKVWPGWKPPTLSWGSGFFRTRENSGSHPIPGGSRLRKRYDALALAATVAVVARSRSSRGAMMRICCQS